MNQVKNVNQDKKNIAYIKRMNENNIKINNPTLQEMDVFERQEMAKNRKVVTSKINKFYNWLINFVPEPIKDKASKTYKLMKSKILGLYKSVGHTDQTVKEETRQEIEEGDLTEPKIILIGDTTRIKKYEVTGNLNNNLSNLIFNNIKSVVEMRTKVIYSFSCDIFKAKNELIRYHKTMSNNKTFTSLREIENYIKECELRRLDLEDSEIWSKAYLPATRIVDNPNVYEGRVIFLNVHIKLISSNEPLMGCGPLPDWLKSKKCIYTVLIHFKDNLCVCGDVLAHFL